MRTIVSHIRSGFAAAFFPRLSEWFPAAVISGIGWMLSANEDLMARDPSISYDQLLEIAPQGVWSVGLLLFGTLRLTVLLINGAWRRSPWLRAGMAFLSCFVWTVLALSFSRIFGFAFIAFVGWLGQDLFNVMRAMRDARTVDDAVRDGSIGSK